MPSQPPRVFISYSHDSSEHAQHVLELAERLRKDGVDAHLDQYVAGTPPEGWPRWMLDRLDWADFVLVACTETYYRRFRGHENRAKGKGADWEGNLITLEMYDAKSTTTKFVPVLFDGQNERFIPEPLCGHTRYLLNSQENYDKLYALLVRQAGVTPGELGPLKTLARGAVEPLTFSEPGEKTVARDKFYDVLDRRSDNVKKGTDPDALRNSSSHRARKDKLSPKRWKEIALYGLLSLITFLCGAGIFSLLISNSDLLARLGLSGDLQCLILLPMGLAAAASLSGFLRSYALYSGKKLGRVLELSGSAAAFFLVVLIVWAIKPPPNSNEVKIGDQIFLRSWDGSYVIAASSPNSNWPRLGKIGKVPLTLLGTEQVRNGGTVVIQSLEQHLKNGENVLAVADSRECYYQKLASDDARQEWKIEKVDATEPVLHYGEQFYLENVSFKNKRLGKDPQYRDANHITEDQSGGEYLTIEEGVNWWWILEKKQF